MRMHLKDLVSNLCSIKKPKIKEIKVLDIGCNDGTLLNFYPKTVEKFGIDPSQITKKIDKKKITQLVNHKKNQGKGAAIQTAQKLVQGDIVLIQDGDLEYEPSDYHKLLKEIYNGNKVVYGSRVLGKKRYLTHNFSSILRVFYNHILTIISNILNNQDLTDAHTCYKMFQSSIFLKIKLKEKDFSFCPEITTKIGLKNIKIKEIPIKYYGRSYEEGKKINFMDGIKALLTLFKYRFFV